MEEATSTYNYTSGTLTFDSFHNFVASRVPTTGLASPQTSSSSADAAGEMGGEKNHQEQGAAVSSSDASASSSTSNNNNNIIMRHVASSSASSSASAAGAAATTAKHPPQSSRGGMPSSSSSSGMSSRVVSSSGPQQQQQPSRTTSTSSSDSLYCSESDWVILKKLGSGAYGEVSLAYSAQDPSKTPVALKTAILDDSSGSGGTVAELKRECDFLMQTPTHPGFVQLLGFERFERGARVAMEYCEGGSLDQFVSKIKKTSNNNGGAGVPEHFARRIALHLLDALAPMHELKITHRDIKPANILLVHAHTSSKQQGGGGGGQQQQQQQHPEGEKKLDEKELALLYPKLADFGSSTSVIVQEDGGFNVVGTLRYLAPEIYLSQPLPGGARGGGVASTSSSSPSTAAGGSDNNNNNSESRSDDQPTTATASVPRQENEKTNSNNNNNISSSSSTKVTKLAGPAADLWALGATLVAILSGKSPWVDDIDNAKSNISGGGGSSSSDQQQQNAPSNHPRVMYQKFYNFFYEHRNDDVIAPSFVTAASADEKKNIQNDDGANPLLSEDGRDFLKQLFARDPKRRGTAQSLMKHKWLQPVLGEVFSSSLARRNGNDNNNNNSNSSLAPAEVDSRIERQRSLIRYAASRARRNPSLSRHWILLGRLLMPITATSIGKEEGSSTSATTNIGSYPSSCHSIGDDDDGKSEKSEENDGFAGIQVSAGACFVKFITAGTGEETEYGRARCLAKGAELQPKNAFWWHLVARELTERSPVFSPSIVVATTTDNNNAAAAAAKSSSSSSSSSSGPTKKKKKSTLLQMLLKRDSITWTPVTAWANAVQAEPGAATYLTNLAVALQAEGNYKSNKRGTSQQSKQQQQQQQQQAPLRRQTVCEDSMSETDWTEDTEQDREHLGNYSSSSTDTETDVESPGQDSNNNESSSNGHHRHPSPQQYEFVNDSSEASDVVDDEEEDDDDGDDDDDEVGEGGQFEMAREDSVTLMDDYDGDCGDDCDDDCDEQQQQQQQAPTREQMQEDLIRMTSQCQRQEIWAETPPSSNQPLPPRQQQQHHHQHVARMSNIMDVVRMPSVSQSQHIWNHHQQQQQQQQQPKASLDRVRMTSKEQRAQIWEAPAKTRPPPPPPPTQQQKQKEQQQPAEQKKSEGGFFSRLFGSKTTTSSSSSDPAPAAKQNDTKSISNSVNWKHQQSHFASRAGRFSIHPSASSASGGGDSSSSSPSAPRTTAAVAATAAAPAVTKDQLINTRRAPLRSEFSIADNNDSGRRRNIEQVRRSSVSGQFAFGGPRGGEDEFEEEEVQPQSDEKKNKKKNKLLVSNEGDPSVVINDKRFTVVMLCAEACRCENQGSSAWLNLAKVIPTAFASTSTPDQQQQQKQKQKFASLSSVPLASDRIGHPLEKNATITREECLQKAVHLDERNAEAWFQLALCRYNSIIKNSSSTTIDSSSRNDDETKPKSIGDYDAVISCLVSCVENDVSHRNAWQLLATMLMDAKKKKRADDDDDGRAVAVMIRGETYDEVACLKKSAGK